MWEIPEFRYVRIVKVEVDSKGKNVWYVHIIIQCTD